MGGGGGGGVGHCVQVFKNKFVTFFPCGNQILGKILSLQQSSANKSGYQRNCIIRNYLNYIQCGNKEYMY